MKRFYVNYGTWNLDNDWDFPVRMCTRNVWEVKAQDHVLELVDAREVTKLECEIARLTQRLIDTQHEAGEGT